MQRGLAVEIGAEACRPFAAVKAVERVGAFDAEELRAVGIRGGHVRAEVLDGGEQAEDHAWGEVPNTKP